MDFSIGFGYSLSKDLFKLFKHKRKFSNKNNFKTLKRETNYVIYADGTVIIHIIYEIKMIKNGDFEIEKYYECVNPNNKLKINKIYKNFYETANKKSVNRFKNQVLVVDLVTPHTRQESVFISEIDSIFLNRKTNKERIKYNIKYKNLKKGDTFKFCISLTIPKEFAINNNNKLSVEQDKIKIDHSYKEYIFRTKIDKQHKLAEHFSPECYLDKERKEPKSCENIYYKCFEWNFKNPPEGEIIIKFN